MLVRWHENELLIVFFVDSQQLMLDLQVFFNIFVMRLHEIALNATICIQIIVAKIETILLQRSIAAMVVETDPFIAKATIISIFTC